MTPPVIRWHPISKFFLQKTLFSYLCVVALFSFSAQAALFARLIAEEAGPCARIARLAVQHGWATQEAIYQNRESIRSLIKARPLQDDFYDQTRHDTNLYNCYVRTRLLSALMSIGDPESAELAAADLRRKKWLWDDGAGFDYAHEYGVSEDSGKNLSIYLRGLWPVVSILDPLERPNLVSACMTGSLKHYPLSKMPFSRNVYIRESVGYGNSSFPLSPQLAAFIQSLGQTDFLHKDDTPRDQMGRS